MDEDEYTTALFAGGCFWCVEADFKRIPGVIHAMSGYAGGVTDHPTYETYAEGGHREVVLVTYDPSVVSYRELADHFIRTIDPTDAEGSFHDRGVQYSPALYYQTDEERADADAVVRSLKEQKVFDAPLAVDILPTPLFWPAEAYHQDYAEKNPERYGAYRQASGRDSFIKQHWGAKHE